MRILLVDDSELQRYANAQALAHASDNVTTAGDGAEGLRIARQTLPDLILLDMMLPKMSGPDVLRALKADSLTAQIPVLVLTGLSQANEPKLSGRGRCRILPEVQPQDGRKLLNSTTQSNAYRQDEEANGLVERFRTVRKKCFALRRYCLEELWLAKSDLVSN